MHDADSILDLTVPELIAARALGLAAVLKDLRASEDLVADLTGRIQSASRLPFATTPESLEATEHKRLEADLNRLREDTAARRTQAEQRLEALSSWPDACRLLGLARLSTDDPTSCLVALEAALARLGTEQSGDRPTWVLLESLASTELPKKRKWVLGESGSYVPTFIQYQPQVSAEGADVLIHRLTSLHKRARKRITKDAMPPGIQATIGLVSLALSVTVPGSDAVGTFIGVHLMGLHGAAATSAGLAALGGGSLASGGFGMAGGAIVAGGLIKGVESATRRVALAQMIARVSSAAFISELASMDVRCTLEPELQPEVVRRLTEIEQSIRTEWVVARPDPAERRHHIWGQLSALREAPSSYKSVVKAVRQELPQSEERNLATSVRALEYEMRHLESPDWKRRTSAVPRFFGVPIAARLIDKAESFMNDDQEADTSRDRLTST